MMDADERELFERSLDKAVASATGSDLDSSLDDIGWRDALAVERRISTQALFAAQGRAGATSSALSWVFSDGLGLVTDDPVVLPGIGTWDAPGRPAGATILGSGLVLAAGSAADGVVMVVDDGERHVAHRVSSDAIETRSVGGVDERFALLHVEVDGAASTELGEVDWEGGLAVGRLAVAHELVGASRSMLGLAREHALDRIQFGRPIAAFQAVRHRLADTLIAVENAEAAIDGAWSDGSPLAAAIAKAVAGRSARTAARHCQQVLAGIGFTAEHPLHLYIRRVLVLDGLLGGADSLTVQLGRQVLATRRLPPMLPL